MMRDGNRAPTLVKHQTLQLVSSYANDFSLVYQLSFSSLLVSLQKDLPLALSISVMIVNTHAIISDIQLRSTLQHGHVNENNHQKLLSIACSNSLNLQQSKQISKKKEIIGVKITKQEVNLFVEFRHSNLVFRPWASNTMAMYNWN